MSHSSQNPVIPPRPDVAYMSTSHGTTGRPPPPPQRTTSSSKTPVRKEPPPVPPHPDPEWIEREELRLRELEEARARATQMEKTMRWWSDCTANWREKWSKVRNERNKLRDECRHLRSKLETSVKECSGAKRERNELRQEVSNLKKLLDQFQSGSLSSQQQSTLCQESKSKSKEPHEASVCSSGSHKSGSDQDLQSTTANASATNSSLKQQDSLSSSNIASGNQEDFLSKLLSRKERDGESSSSSHSGTSKSERHVQKEGEVTSPADDTALQQKLTILQLKLDEIQKTLQNEREGKCEQQKSLENLQMELSALQSKHEELRQAKEEAMRELSAVRREHENQLGRVTSELAEESTRGDSMDRRVASLRRELERLQSENAQEWAKRERLETEKLALERENKKLKNEVESLEEELVKKTQQASTLIDSDLKTAQLELAEKTKELADLRHSYSKMKKAIQERNAELEHAKSRAEQYELDVKKLRTRIDELKQELGSAEDEADQQAHQVRKLQRSNDELQQQVENLSVQVQHLQTRLLRSNSSLSTHTVSLSSYDANDSMTEGGTDED
ncbi:hypothetical protein LSH36_362g02009 [Paralvinella palmiformis]|uniref:Coiled-coil domain-containing protein 102A n=1 Tax=Paralvinella palmiformis TaxID=53620 RepID=A0AAD9N1E0_9ANNE|nr:hypothetical protein LSH36_362g02009 [Paralvinella palmiformis]